MLRAYRESCAVCRLRHAELLDAAHILPDWHPQGTPVLPNGLSLCRLHHGAFDANILGIRPDFVIELRKDVLDRMAPCWSTDFKVFQGRMIRVPTNPLQQPDRIRLERSENVPKGNVNKMMDHAVLMFCIVLRFIVMHAVFILFSISIFSANAGVDFEILFGQDFRKVTATSTIKDDIEFAAKLLQYARSVTGNPDLREKICEKTFELGIKESNGYRIAYDSMKLLIDGISL